jgi:hypothetical protein
MKKLKSSFLARAAITLLLAVFCSAGAWATSGTPTGTGTSGDPYVIDDAADWATFASWINAGTNADKYYKLGDAFDNSGSAVTATVGTEAHPFQGTFDGNHKTLKVNINVTSTQGTAPFRNISGATIKDLTIEGTVKGTTHTAGLVGFTRGGSNTIDGCTVNADVSVTSGTYRHMGGVLGHGVKATVLIRNTVFAGTMSNSKDYAGGLQGWSDGNTLTIENCLFKGSYTGSASFHPIAIHNSGSNTTYTDHGAYYTAAPTLTDDKYIAAAGAMVSATAPTNDLYKQMTFIDDDDYYILCTTSGVDVVYFYTGNDITVTPVVKVGETTLEAGTHYSVDISPATVLEPGDYTMTITGKAPYKGTKEIAFKVITQLNGGGTKSDPYIIASTADWNTFAASVAGGINYQGKFIRLTNDITISTMVGVYGDSPFRGTFDGGIYDGDNVTGRHTLTVNITSDAAGNDGNVQGVAPFHYIYGATIKNLNVAGTVTSASAYAGGLVGRTTQWSSITDCVVTTAITTSADHAGGFVGVIDPYDGNASIKFTNCVFAGTIENTSGDQNRRAGGFLGYGDDRSNFTDCLENGTYHNLTMMNPRSGVDYYYSTNRTVTSLCYVNKIGNVGNYITDDYGCHQVTLTAPSESMYLKRSLHGYEFYQPVFITGLDETYPYNNGEAVSLSYALKLNSTTLTEGTDYEVSYSPAAPAAVGNYTVTFTAKEDNQVGYKGAMSRSFRVMVGESLDGYVFATEGEGDNKVYLINDESDLERMAAYVNSGHDAQGKTFKLKDNITMTAPHTPIAGLTNNYYRYFRGTFDGNEKTITNLTVNNPNADYQGLFGYTSDGAVIKNVTLANCNITGKQYTGGIVGNANSTTIQKCHVSGSIAATVEGAALHGGITGCASSVTIEDCTVTGTISTSKSNKSYGGIVGKADYQVTIKSCENTASITGEGEEHGGIVGYERNNSNNFNQCLNTGIVEGTNYVGGIAGRYEYSTAFSYCYYATPCNVNALGYSNGSGGNVSGRAERGYTITKDSHIESLTVTETDGVLTSVLTGKKYYNAGNWTLTLTPSLSDETFITYACEGGTLTNLDTAAGEHTLTITDKDVTISAVVSSNNGIDIANATIASIPEQRWRAGDPVILKSIDVTYGGTRLVLGTDYLMECSNNTDMGDDAVVTITGINGYRKTKKAYFTIADFPLVNPDADNSAENPWKIATEEDLEALAAIVNSGTRNNGYYRQTADIVCSGEHTSIGYYNYNNEQYQFIGSFDGKDGETQHTISNLTINKPENIYQGLFGILSGATVKNVVLVDCDITSGTYTGGIAGLQDGGIIDNCSVSGAIKVADGESGSCHGGIVGQSSQVRYGTIDNCVNAASVTGKGQEHGGIAGSVSNSRSIIKNCFNAGIVEGTSKNVGSLVGGNAGIISNSYHTVGTTGGVGSGDQSTGTDQEGAEVVAKISADDGVTITYPATPTYVWNGENLYKNGTVVTLKYNLPDENMFFDCYTVSNGEISNAGVMTGEHTLTGFTKNVVISGSYVDTQTDITGVAVIDGIEALTYNGSVQHPVPVVTLGDVTLEKGTHYTVSYSDDCTNVGNYKVTVTGTGRYTGSVWKEFTINPFNVNNCEITMETPSYTGSVIELNPTLKRDGTTMIQGADKDYTFTTDPAEVLAVGNYTMTITGHGNYVGTKEIQFQVIYAVPTDLTCKALTATTATLKWSGVDGTATDIPQWTVEYSFDNTFATSQTVTLDAPTATLEGLVPETFYYARVKAVYGEGEESEWSTVCKFEPTAKLIIGSAWTTDYNLPTNSYYHYSLSQQIYTAAELDHKAGTICSIDFYKKSGTCDRTLDIYLVKTDKSQFSSQTDWIKVTAADKVFSGQVNFADNAWTTITLTTPFVYDGTSNLALVIDDNTGSYISSSRDFLSYSGSSYQSLYNNDDYVNLDPTTTLSVTGKRGYVKNHVRLLIKGADVVLANNDSQAAAEDKNSAKIEANNGKVVDVQLYARYFSKDSEWNTICLPFNVMIANSPLAGATARTLTNANITGTTLHLTFGDAVTTLKAGTPYIIKWEPGTADIQNPKFESVYVQNVTNNYDNKVTGEERVRFIGTYGYMSFPQGTVYQDILLMGDNNQLFYPDGEGASWLGACRAYFKIGEDGGTARQITGFDLNFDDGETTGIITITDSVNSSNSDAWYTIDGMKLDGKPTKKGVYIVNGKKTVIR